MSTNIPLACDVVKKTWGLFHEVKVIKVGSNSWSIYQGRLWILLIHENGNYWMHIGLTKQRLMHKLLHILSHSSVYVMFVVMFLWMPTCWLDSFLGNKLWGWANLNLTLVSMEDVGKLEWLPNRFGRVITFYCHDVMHLVFVMCVMLATHLSCG